MSLPASSPPPPPHGGAQGGHGGGAHRAAGRAAPKAGSSKGFRHKSGLASPLGAAVTRAAAYTVGASVAGVVTARALAHPAKAVAKDGLAGMGNVQDGLSSIGVGLGGVGVGLLALAAATAFSQKK